MSFLEIRGLSLALGGRTVLDGISFSLERGRLLAIIGPNGAGKSSLLKCLGRLYTSFSGEVLLEGSRLDGTPQKEIARRIAWVHQEGLDSLPYTVREFAEMSRYPWRSAFGGMSARDREYVEEALALTGADAFAERCLKSLSGGERQNALIAAALAQGTDILFLDEPTSFLDYRHQAETLKLIERINKEHSMTIALVTHDVNLALRIADEILALKNGLVAWSGPRQGFIESGLMSGVFDTEFVCFKAKKDGMPYVAPRVFVE